MAAYHLGELKGKEKENDLERRTIGIGETVALTAFGKRMDEHATVEWKMEGEGATLSHKGGTTAVLTA